MEEKANYIQTVFYLNKTTETCLKKCEIFKNSNKKISEN